MSPTTQTTSAQPELSHNSFRLNRSTSQSGSQSGCCACVFEYSGSTTDSESTACAKRPDLHRGHEKRGNSLREYSPDHNSRSKLTLASPKYAAFAHRHRLRSLVGLCTPSCIGYRHWSRPTLELSVGFSEPMYADPSSLWQFRERLRFARRRVGWLQNNSAPTCSYLRNPHRA